MTRSGRLPRDKVLLLAQVLREVEQPRREIEVRLDQLPVALPDGVLDAKAPAAAIAVGRMSSWMIGCSTTRPAAMRPFHCARNGT